MTGSPITVVPHGPGVAEVRLDRPDRHNAVDTDLLRQLRAGLAEISEDRTTKVVVLTGAGPSFCAGADLAEFAGGDIDPADALGRIRLVIGCIRGLLELEAVTIAAVHGAAVGAGWGLALGCDLCWASDRATFRLPEVAKGYRIPRVLVRRLAQVIGPIRAAQVVLAGEVHDVDAAMAMGVVTRRFPDADALHRAAIAFAEALAAQPRAVLAGAIDPLRALAVDGPLPELEYQWPESRA